MTKVKNTKTHTTGQHPKFCDVLVTDANLVLVDYKVTESVLEDRNGNGSLKYQFKPILISQTEKIEVDDWVLEYMMGKPYDVIQVTQEDLNRCKINFANRSCFKIIALPEHFSPQQLQMIVDGKLKDGDKVLVECDIDETIPEPHNCEVIKLNPHITIYVEEKKHSFTGKEKAMFEAVMECLSELTSLANGYENDYVEYKEWFEQNIK